MVIMGGNMPEMEDHGTMFGRLKAILQFFEPKFHLTADELYDYQLSTVEAGESGRQVPFGGVRGEGEGVDFCLQAIADSPELLVTASNRLKEHMQSQTCFHFTVLDDEILYDLAQLAESAYAFYVSEGLAS
jgi:hypothetical protein